MDDNAGCRLRYIHKPDFKRYTGTYWGAWFKDAQPPATRPGSASWSDKIWVSLHYRGSTLLEYANYDDFRLVYATADEADACMFYICFLGRPKGGLMFYP